jgi:hypothetical protein
MKFTKLQQIILSEYIGMEFSSNVVLVKPFERILLHLLEAGISDKFVKEEAMYRPKDPVKEDVKLSLDHLGVWFYACAIMLIIATCAFVIELATHKCLSKPAKGRKTKKICKNQRSLNKLKNSNKSKKGWT